MQSIAGDEAESCFMAGSYLMRKDIVDRNPKRALEIFSKGCGKNVKLHALLRYTSR